MSIKRYLIRKKREKAFLVLNRIAKFNGKEELSEDELQRIELNLKNNGKIKMYSYLDLFRYKSIRSCLIGCFIVYFSIQVIYYGSEFALSNLGFDLYLNACISPFFDILGYLCASKIK